MSYPRNSHLLKSAIALRWLTQSEFFGYFRPPRASQGWNWVHHLAHWKHAKVKYESNGARESNVPSPRRLLSVLRRHSIKNYYQRILLLINCYLLALEWFQLLRPQRDLNIRNYLTWRPLNWWIPWEAWSVGLHFLRGPFPGCLRSRPRKRVDWTRASICRWRSRPAVCTLGGRRRVGGLPPQILFSTLHYCLCSDTR